MKVQNFILVPILAFIFVACTEDPASSNSELNSVDGYEKLTIPSLNVMKAYHPRSKVLSTDPRYYDADLKLTLDTLLVSSPENSGWTVAVYPIENFNGIFLGYSIMDGFLKAWDISDTARTIEDNTSFRYWRSQGWIDPKPVLHDSATQSLYFNVTVDTNSLPLRREIIDPMQTKAGFAFPKMDILGFYEIYFKR